MHGSISHPACSMTRILREKPSACRQRGLKVLWFNSLRFFRRGQLRIGRRPWVAFEHLRTVRCILHSVLELWPTRQQQLGMSARPNTTATTVFGLQANLFAYNCTASRLEPALRRGLLQLHSAKISRGREKHRLFSPGFRECSWGMM